MILETIFGLALFVSLIYYTTSTSNDNIKQIIDKDQFIKKEELLKLIQIEISNSIRLLEQKDITINYQCIDQWFLKANLTHINLKDFKYDMNQIDIQFEYQNNTMLLRLPIQQFDLVVHFELWDIYQNSTQQITFHFRVQDTYMEIRYKMNAFKILVINDWFPKFRFGAFEIVVDEEIQKYQKVKKIVDWLLYKFHSTIQNILVQNLMKSLDFASFKKKNIYSKNDIKMVKNLQFQDSQTLLMTVQMYKDEVFRLDDFIQKLIY